ncbi:hypothetical protein NMG29_23545 [Streptomyces cocklensis]|jgi:hypothetical protein|uniref:Uncharacterized protein n=1 Tax=Actinacidiphila cocklensis TaxID=887465 RepID=A0A9W4GUW2_9ACTN|nr:hypothetical protein [Actinacidiphila cocklensis]MDD1061154.1 hypothetical protein [Actinacidiphila cocklensis]WSX77470.1 hypothetical protein OH826_28655 [Streptomyces sp. NBC_00899]CAG6398609.1 conserved hypothetical protein [Actinacidiphila cocklensis]
MHHHTFPADLVQAQRDWYATYRQLAGAAGTQTTVLRRRLVRLSVMVTAHPYWATVPSSAPAARMQLKALAWGDEADGHQSGREAEGQAGATAG